MVSYRTTLSLAGSMAAKDSRTQWGLSRPEDGQAEGRARGVEGVGTAVSREDHTVSDIWNLTRFKPLGTQTSLAPPPPSVPSPSISSEQAPGRIESPPH